MDLATRFLAHLAGLGVPPGTALVAVSGGPDSVALLDLLARHRSAHGLALVVAHADHGIHPDSGRVAERVAALAEAYGLPARIGRLALGAAAGETGARRARYAWLAREAARAEAGSVFLGHHLDDQAETVLMRTLHGSAPVGLAGMASRRGRLVRPLLPFRRAELAQYVLDHGLESWDDPANADPRHLRSWLRHAVLPVLAERLPRVEERLGRVAAAAARDRAAWDAALEHLPDLALREEHGGLSVVASALCGYPSELGEAVLRAAARRAGLALTPARARRALAALASGRSGSVAELGGGWRLEASFGRAHLVRPSAAGAPDAWSLGGADGERGFGDWTIRWRMEPAPAEQRRAARSAWFVPGALAVRGPRPGDRVRPLGGVGGRPLVRCFHEARVRRSRRPGWPVVEADGRIVWVPGVVRSGALVPLAGVEALRVDVANA